MNERLTARVIAENRANEIATELSRQLLAIFAPFVGQKITKQGGDLTEKVKKLLPKLPNSNHASVHRERGAYSLAFKVSCYENTSRGGVYQDVMIYVGEMDGHTLTKLSQPFVGQTYTVEEIERKRSEYEIAKKLYQDAQHALYPFGEHDNH